MTQDHPELRAPAPVIEMLSWRLAAELVRRHPARLWPVHHELQFGFYDLLVLRPLKPSGSELAIQINRSGGNTFVSRADGRDGGSVSWTDACWTGDVHAWLTAVEACAALSPPTTGLPPSTPASLAVRWISGFLCAQMLSREAWHARCVWEAPSATAGPIAQTLRARWSDDLAGAVWGVGRGERLELAVTSQGQLLRDGHGDVDLMTAYRAGGNTISGLLARTAPDFVT